jgi:hypothetical protein
MNTEIRQTWISIVLATGLAVAVAGSACMGTIPLPEQDPSPGFGWSWDFDFQRAIREPNLTLNSDINKRTALYPGELILPVGKPVSVADLRLIYRGPTGMGKFGVDVIIPVLDPDYAYANAIDRSDQGKELDFYGQRFEVAAIGDQVLRLRHLTP